MGANTGFPLSLYEWSKFWYFTGIVVDGLTQQFDESVGRLECKKQHKQPGFQTVSKAIEFRMISHLHSSILITLATYNLEESKSSTKKGVPIKVNRFKNG